ncbi:nitroreductase family protein [Clostridium coskatii]|uniref:FMN reductase n=1 Tax=Clostridium coskatii TaxID=1705578 RepID=A0A168R610_9CLOT|nr:nitroreductase family protein [Clostridium coskatii]OAA90093.1 FMN reductase [NAD(P)H] [Clostridium coskatii]OBR92735.1 FMN reductase [Clostridium coskatii]
MLELLKKRRSIRKYTNEKVSDEKILNLIQAALFSPTSKNSKSCEFIIVKDKNLLSKLSNFKPGASFLKNADLGIIVMGNSLLSDVWIEDASIAASNIHLLSQEIDLGSCWIQVRNRNYNENTSSEEYIRNLFNVPENINILAVISVGFPGEQKDPLTEENLNYNKVYLNSYLNKYLK